MLASDNDNSTDQDYLKGRTEFVKDLEGFKPRNKIDKRLLIGLIKRRNVDISDEDSDEEKKALQR